MHSKYIVLEGLEGAGKTTLCNILVEILRNEFDIQKIFVTREPGGTKLAERLRDLVLNSKSVDNEAINNKVETLLFYAARVQLIETVIKPTLAAGYWVIGDRHDLSTQVYQGSGRGIDRETLITLRNIMLEDFRPHLTLYLDVTPEIGLKRTYIANRGSLDRIEQESLDFFTRIRSSYLELTATDDSIRTIDATKSIEDVTFRIYKIINQWFQEQKM